MHTRPPNKKANSPIMKNTVKQNLPENNKQIPSSGKEWDHIQAVNKIN
jgi:hypothetical protein